MQPASVVKTKQLDSQTVLRRIKDIATRLKNPKELYEYVDTMADGYSDLGRLINLFPYDPDLTQDTTALFGHFDELHDRIAGKQGVFTRTIAALGDLIKSDGKTGIKIGVSRYNFFCLDEIAQLYLDLKGSKGSPALPQFTIFPVERIIKNFISYAQDLNEKVRTLGIEFILCDEELVEILQIIQFHMQRGKVSDKDLVRLLGVISEHAFIGPQTIVFDPYHRCNIKCKHCFVHNPLIHHQEGFLDRKFDYEIYKRIIDDAAELKTDGIILQGDGEPLLYDRFFDMLRYARGKGIGVMFFTNGSLIGESQAREIVDLCIREIYCSFPAGCASTYKAVTSAPEDVFHKIVQNLKGLMQIKRERGQHDPRLTMTHVIHTLNHHELIKMAKVDAEIKPDAARFYLIRLDDNNKHLKLNDQELEVIKRDLPVAARIFKDNGIDFVDNILFQLDHYDDATGAWSKDIFLQEGCTIGWYFCLIPALLDVSMCCHLRTVGYLNKQGFKELWASREYRRYRINAKYLKENADFTFPNGVKLFDEHCEHCDNHQTLITNLENLHALGLYKFCK